VDDYMSRKIALAKEVERRLRLDRFPRTGITVGLTPGKDFDVRVTIAPPNSALATRVEELCGDIRLKISQGTWHRA
jgi:hypothetical protein